MSILSDFAAFELKVDVKRFIALQGMVVGKVSPIAAS